MATTYKQMVKDYFRFIDEREMEKLATVLDHQFQLSFTGIPGRMNIEEVGRVFGGFISAFPDIHHVLEEQIEEGDTVVTKVKVCGTHLGDFQGIPATGRAVEFPSINFTRFSGGKILANDVHIDLMGMMQQIGAIPQPA